MEAPPGFEPGIRALQARALPLGYGAILVPGAGLEPAQPQWPGDFKSPVSTNSTIRASRTPKCILLFIERSDFRSYGAGDGIRTRDPNLGKVVLYP